MIKIEYLAHSCFKITSDGCDIIIDPYKEGYVPGTRKLKERADLVLSSHNHADHNATDEIDTTKSDFAKAGNVYKIKKIETFHDKEQGNLRGKTTIHLIETKGYKIAHLGDLGCDLTPQEVEMLYNLEVLMIPVGGFYTIDGKEAKKIVEKIKPKIVIPMHFRGKNFGFDNIDEVRAFAKLFDKVENNNKSEYFIQDIEVENKIVVLKPKYIN